MNKFISPTLHHEFFVLGEEEFFMDGALYPTFEYLLEILPLFNFLHDFSELLIPLA